MMFTIEFMRVRASDNAHAMLDRLSNVAANLDEAKVREGAVRHMRPAAGARCATHPGQGRSRAVLLEPRHAGRLTRAHGARRALASCRGKRQDAGIPGDADEHPGVWMPPSVGLTRYR